MMISLLLISYIGVVAAFYLAIPKFAPIRNDDLDTDLRIVL